jgi:hypothetical protein
MPLLLVLSRFSNRLLLFFLRFCHATIPSLSGLGGNVTATISLCKFGIFLGLQLFLTSETRFMTEQQQLEPSQFVDRMPAKMQVALDIVDAMQSQLRPLHIQHGGGVTIAEQRELTAKEEAAFSSALDYIERFLDSPDIVYCTVEPPQD